VVYHEECPPVQDKECWSEFTEECYTEVSYKKSVEPSKRSTGLIKNAGQNSVKSVTQKYS
jgi:hypothetical protein